MADNLLDLPSTALRESLASGAVSAEQLTEASLHRISKRDGEIGAFLHVDREFALSEARARDARRQSGQPIGPLHGLPVGIKDIIDTADLPTENGTPIDERRRPSRDAWVVERLRAAGAVIIGKTATTELAYFSPAGTRNPHDTSRTPGGSSSGSAAAVAAGMLPLAVGTQTNGSVIRPAAFCGVVGFKPTFGLIPRTGILRQSELLDTVGVFARSVADAAMLAETLQGADPGDTSTRQRPPIPMLADALSDPPVKPAFALVRSPRRALLTPDADAAFSELAESLGENCDHVELPDIFEHAFDAHRKLMLAGFAYNLKRYGERGDGRLSARMQQALAEGQDIRAHEYLAALEWRQALKAGLARIFERYDAILTPAAPGIAPLFEQGTGDPSFCTIWTLCGAPSMTLPLLVDEQGMPIGVQLVGANADDGRLLRTANWLAQKIQEADATAT